jgi:F-box protein 18 (helicase)
MPGFGGAGGFTSASAILRASAREKEKTEERGADPTPAEMLAPPAKRDLDGAAKKRHASSVPAPFFGPRAGGSARPAAPPGGKAKPPSKGRGFKPSDPSKPFSAWSKEEQEAFRAEKRRKEDLKMEEKKARQKCRQGSIFGAFAAAADRSRGQAEKRCLADELPMPLKQKILANLPAGALGDARAVSASWRDAVDDEAFLRFAKMAAHLRGWAHNAGRDKNQNRSDLSSDEGNAARENDDEGVATSATTPALVARREAHADWFRERGVVNAAGVVRFLASHASNGNPSRRPFATPLTCEALVDALRDAEAEREHARVALGEALVAVSVSGKKNAEVSVSVSDASRALAELGPAPGAGLAATVRELSSWRLVENDGWALLALAAFTAVDDATTMRFLFEGAERAAKTCAANAAEVGVVAELCPRLDLDEFANLLVAAMSSASWREWSCMEGGGVFSFNLHVDVARLARLAHVEEATGAIELARANAAPGSASGRRELTHEQLAVVTSEVRDDEVMLVRAFAGTGKTTTLLEYVRRRPDKRFAYLTFNRAVMEEAKSKFPANTKALSFHGLAYRKFGFLFQGKFHRGALRAHHVHEATGLPQSDERNILAIRTLEAFLISPDPEVSEAHVPPRRDLDRTYDSGAVKKRLAEEARRSGGEVPTPARDLVSLATKLWTSMKDKTCLKSKMTDAGYLKLYQLSRPKLHLDFEVLMLDEAQDAAPVMADIVLQQTGCAKILVGDPHQEIYSFMGARDAMRAAVARVDKSKVTERRLSRSFRFGREIAAVANSLLRLKGETAPVLGAAREAGDARTPRRPPPLLERSETRSADETELEPSSETVDALCEAVRAETAAGAVKVVANTYAALKAHAPARDPSEKGRYVSRRFERRSQLVVLCRSNASVFEAAEMIHGFPGATLGVVGGTQSLRLEQLMDVYRLATYACEEDLLEISDKYVATFAKKELAFLEAASEEERRARDRLGILRRQSQLSDDKEMQMKLGIVARLGSNLPGIVDDMIKRCVDPKRHESAHFLLSTAHKVKGLEYPSVLLWHDFVDVGGIRRRGARYFAQTNDGFGEMGSEEVDSDEINLLYVAATRAKRELFLPRFVAHVHGGFSDFPDASRRAEHNVGYDAVGRLVQGGPGSVVALRALGYLGGEVSNAGGEGETPSGSSRRSRRRFRPAPVAEPAAQTQMDADRRERVGVNPKRVSCCVRRGATTCSTSARDVAKFAPSGEAVAGSRVCEALGLALAGGRATAPTPSDSVYIEGFTGAADRDFHAAATGAWWGDHADLARASDRAAFERLARAINEDGDRQGFATFATRAGSWSRFACPACQDAARASARRLRDDFYEARSDVRDAFASFTAAESASAWEILETCEAEARARGWEPAGEGQTA